MHEIEVIREWHHINQFLCNLESGVKYNFMIRFINTYVAPTLHIEGMSGVLRRHMCYVSVSFQPPMYVSVLQNTSSYHYAH